MSSTIAVIVAAGEGRRFSEKSQKNDKKQFLEHEGLPLWVSATLPFEKSSHVDQILIVVPKQSVLSIQEKISRYELKKVISVVEGGIQRQDSVLAALDWIEAHKIACSYIMIHDGVRPFLTSELIDRLWSKKELNAVIPVVPISDTIKVVESDTIYETVDRGRLYRAQTPQLFKYVLLKQAYENFFKCTDLSLCDITDDAGAVELLGKSVFTVPGEHNNIKVTFPEDLNWGGLSKNVVPEKTQVHIRVGQGMDIHAFCEGNRIVLGGIQIPFHKALRGHSDADVLTHAICDALLGGVGLEDIGTHFPDSDPKYKGISSLSLLEKVVDKVGQAGYTIKNIDCTVVAEAPRLMDYISEMKMCLAKVCGLSVTQFGLKAKTSEGLGWIGRKEGIAAIAIALLETADPQGNR